MKVAIIYSHPIHYAHVLFQAMKARGLEFEVLYVAAGSSIRHEKTPQLSLGSYRYTLAHDGLYHTASRRVRGRFPWRELSGARPEVVIISGYRNLECWVAWTWALLHRRKVIIWCESNEFDYPRHWIRELPKRLFLSGCDRGHVYGATNKAYLIRLGMRAERIESKRAVVDAAMFSTSAENKVYSTGDTKKLIYVGRLAPEKNLGMLLRAVARAVAARGGSPCLRLTIAGTGPLEQDLRSEASQLRIERIVDFVGYCPQHDLPGLLRAADFFVLPSSREPWGLAALEAMLCRLPVIVSTQCGCAEDLITDETGWKFSPWTEDELSELLRRLPDMPASMVARMGTIAHQVASGYSPEFCARSIEQCVEQATAGRRIARPSSPMPVPERIRSSEER